MSLVGLIVISASSCSRWELEASTDLSKEGETGPSGQKANYDPGVNLFLQMLDGLSGGEITGTDAAEHDEYPGPWSPEAVVPTTKKADGLGLVFTGGYVGKGSKGDGFTERLNYLEVSEAIAFVHKTPGGLLYGGLGPYVAYGIGGKAKFNGGSESVFSSDGYKRFDAGIHFLGEYRFTSGLSLGAGYDLGLFDKSRDPSDYTSRNRTIMVEVGYSLDKIIKAVKGK